MKIKNLSIRLFAIVIAFSSVLSFQSCGDEIELSKKPNIENRIKYISESDIPSGVVPLHLDNMDELYALIDKMDSVKLKIVTPNKFNRFKVFAETGSTSAVTNLANNADYNITITLAWSQHGAPISVDSHNTNTWLFASWTQNTGVANWNSDSKISYNVTGTLKWYVVVSWNFIEIDRQDMTTSGYVNG